MRAVGLRGHMPGPPQFDAGSRLYVPIYGRELCRGSRPLRANDDETSAPLEFTPESVSNRSGIDLWTRAALKVSAFWTGTLDMNARRFGQLVG